MRGDQLIEDLLDECMNVLHHDGEEDEPSTLWELKLLEMKFRHVLVKHGVLDA